MKKRFVIVIFILLIIVIFKGCFGGGKKRTESRLYDDKTETTDMLDASEENIDDAQVDDSIIKKEADTAEYNSEDSLFGDLIDSYEGETQQTESNKMLFEFKPKKYAEVLASPDDEMDYKYASDYRSYRNSITMADSNAYEQVLGFSKPTYADLERKIDSNKYMSDRFKSLYKNALKDWLELWPESDFSIFYKNLDTLKIEECTPSQIALKGMSQNTVACYRNTENVIYVAEGIDPYEKPNDFIVAIHESLHAATTIHFKENGNSVSAITYAPCGLNEGNRIYEETVITNLVYQLRDKDKEEVGKSIYYTVPCSYMRIIMDCVGYDGNDFMNHSCTYLVDKMGDYMGGTAEDDIYAYYMLDKLYYEYELKNNHWSSYEVDTYDDLHKYIIDMYCKKYLKEGMSSLDAEKVFDDFMEEITWNIENLQVEYDESNPDTFRSEFEKCCNELGIEFEKQ